MIDAGWPGARDADRIIGVAKQAGITQIDYLVLTHYHVDHAGGVPELASRIPIRNFVDHGPTNDTLVNVPQYYAAYLKVREKGRHILARPGDTLPIQGLDVPFCVRRRSNHSGAIARRGSRQSPLRGFPAEG